MKYMLGDPQIGYQKGRKIDENIDLARDRNNKKGTSTTTPRWTADYYSC